MVLFGSLVASNYALYTAEEQRMVLYALADRVNAVSTRAEFAKGLAAFFLLSRAQEVMEGGSFSCSDPVSALAPIDAFTHSGSLEGLSAFAQGSVTSLGEGEDNLTLIRPFNGFVPGYLNLLLTVSLSVSVPGLQYHKLERHYLHLPVLYARAITLCLSVLSYLKSGSERVRRTPGRCATSSVESVFQDARDFYLPSASRDGLTLSISSSVLHSQVCPLVEYEVLVSQHDVAGVTGPFTWLLSEGGSLPA